MVVLGLRPRVTLMNGRNFGDHAVQPPCHSLGLSDFRQDGRPVTVAGGPESPVAAPPKEADSGSVVTGTGRRINADRPFDVNKQRARVERGGEQPGRHCVVTYGCATCALARAQRQRSRPEGSKGKGLKTWVNEWEGGGATLGAGAREGGRRPSSGGSSHSDDRHDPLQGCLEVRAAAPWRSGAARRNLRLQPQQPGPSRSGSIAPTRPSCPPARLWPGPGPQACSTGTAGTLSRQDPRPRSRPSWRVPCRGEMCFGLLG